MKIEKVWLNEFTPVPGLVVAIDVIRAFTTAAHAFHSGAKEIIPVSKIEEVFAIHEHFPQTLMMGEIGGEKVDGFHFGNSPTQFEGHSIQGSTIIQRTTCGTQGIIQALGIADHILAGSFPIAKATAQRILQIAPKRVTMLMTSIVFGDEDAALAEYLEQLLLGNTPDPAPYIARAHSEYDEAQRRAIMDLDRFPFAIELFREKPHPILKPVNSNGTLWR